MKLQYPRLSMLATAGGSALLLLATEQSLFAQRFSITNIVVPDAASLSVAAMNASGQVAGYCYTTASEQRAFFWDRGASVDLGTLGGSTSVGNALNNFGQVVGYSSSIGDSEYHGFLGIGHTLFDLGTLGGTVSSATSISDGGHVTGYSHISSLSIDYHAFLKVNNSAMADLGTLGGSTSSGTAVNNFGHVAGNAGTAGNLESHAFLHDGAMHDLGTLGGTYSSAAALNDDGLVTGEATIAGETETHAFLNVGYALHDLGTLGGTFSSGYAINDAGVVAGDSSLAGDNEYHGFIVRNGSMVDLGTLGGSSSSSWAINNANQIVGVSANAAGQNHAFLWLDGVMVDLNTTLPPGSGWELTGAYFINDNGQIAGEGVYQDQPVWFVLTPRADNQPPVARAGQDQTVAATGSSAAVTVDGSASSDPDGDALSFVWSENGAVLGNTASLTVVLPLGVHHLLLSVTDTHQASAQDEVVVTVTGDTVAPTVQCPGNRSASANEHGQAAVPDLLAGLVASDNVTASSALVKTQVPSAGTLVGCGATTVTVTVTDAAGNATTCTSTFTVADTTPPVVHLIEGMTRRAGPAGLAEVPNVLGRIRARDNCTPSNQLVMVQSPRAGTIVGLGGHEIRVTVTDLAGNATTIGVPFHVLDLTPPRIHSLHADPDVLSPANGKMVKVTLTAEATDNCDRHPRLHIASVHCNERVSDGDWKITGDLKLELRAEVLSKSCPRVYTIGVACTDSAGNTSYRNVLVRVPHNKPAQTAALKK